MWLILDPKALLEVGPGGMTICRDSGRGLKGSVLEPIVS